MFRRSAQRRGPRPPSGSRALQTAALVAVLLGAPTPLLAGDVDQAKALFDQGVAEMLGGHLEKACPAIQGSYRLDPRPGTLFTLAECEAQRGRIATAVARYTEFLALYKQFTPRKRAEQKDRADASKAQIDTLTPQVPLVTLRLPPGAPDDVDVRHDGVVLSLLSLSEPLAVDPGDNLFTTQIPGGPPVEHHLEMKKGERRELTLVILREVPVAPTASASAAPSGGPPPVASGAPSATVSAPPPAPTAPLAPAPRDNRAFRIGAIAVGTVGVTGLVFGAVTGILAFDRRATVGRECHAVGAGDACTPAGVTAGEQLKVLGAASTTAFVLGTAGLAAAGILLLVMPASRPAAPSGAPPVRPSAGRPVASVGVSATLGGIRVFGSF